MTKKEFLSELEKELNDLSKDEKISALKYYEDYFEDAGEENEKDVIKELESPKKVAEVIKGEKKENVEYRNSIPTWVIIILILFSPIVLSIVGTLFGIFMGLFGVLIGLLSAGVAIFISGIAATTIGVFKMFTGPLIGLLSIGIGLALLGIGTLITLVTIKLCVLIVPAIIKGIVNLINSIFKGGRK